ncbi:MAG: hypothetical protein HY326_05020 [Chloroflexi bacterium]|nr:hypothetical protein [Chloroflexota bacterium]
MKCSLCGGEFPSAEQCGERFDACMDLEFENPAAFGAVHHLSVACYMLQHNAYSRDVWLEARKMIAQFVQENVTPAEIRKRNRSGLDSRQRKWSITKGAKLAEFDTIVWSRTIADVRLDNPTVYCADVELWAQSILADTQVLVRSVSQAIS